MHVNSTLTNLHMKSEPQKKSRFRWNKALKKELVLLIAKAAIKICKRKQPTVCMERATMQLWDWGNQHRSSSRLPTFYFRLCLPYRLRCNRPQCCVFTHSDRRCPGRIRNTGGRTSHSSAPDRNRERAPDREQNCQTTATLLLNDWQERVGEMAGELCSGQLLINDVCHSLVSSVLSEELLRGQLSRREGDISVSRRDGDRAAATKAETPNPTPSGDKERFGTGLQQDLLIPPPAFPS